MDGNDENVNEHNNNTIFIKNEVTTNSNEEILMKTTVPNFLQSERKFLTTRRKIYSSPSKRSVYRFAQSESDVGDCISNSTVPNQINFDSAQFMSHSTDNLRSNLLSSQSNSSNNLSDYNVNTNTNNSSNSGSANIKNRMVQNLVNNHSNLDDIIESPNPDVQQHKLLYEENGTIFNYSDHNTFHLKRLSSLSSYDGTLSGGDNRTELHDAFGPKILSDIPGTPMINSVGKISDFSASFIDSATANQASSLLTGDLRDRRNFSQITIAKSDTINTNIDSINTNNNNNNYRTYGFPDSKTDEHDTNGNNISSQNLQQQQQEENMSVNHHNIHFNHHNFKDNVDNKRRISKQDIEGLDPESLMFRDGRRKIDMILCYEEENEGVMTESESKRREQRKIFQDCLIREGLELEIEDKSQAFDEKTFFVKVHMPWRTETRYAEVMNLKLPVKRFITISVKAWDEEKSIIAPQNFVKKYWRKFRQLTEYNYKHIDKEPSFYSATAGGNPEEQFIVKDRFSSYTSAQRSSIVWQILLRAKYDETEKVGIRKLLNDDTYLGCFPLHEGRYDKPHSSGLIFDRRLLYLEWARPIKWYKRQPLCLVRKYFGDKIALYFCWLGFYTNMLVLPAVVGTLCFFYGLASMQSDDNQPSKEICDTNGVGNLTLCPLCDKACSYQKLSESCLFSQVTYLFDNPSTVFFAIFMSFWATTFLELWKRKQSVINWEWDLESIDSDEENRPEFETSVKTFRTNPVTREKEPYMPTWSRILRFMATGSAVLFMICVVLAAVLGTIIYRISVVTVIYSGGGTFIRKHAKIFTSMTAALINLIIIMILTRIYHRLAIFLTNLENPRTHTEYEDSFTFKIFFFEFMNFYSSLIYIAFFKGRFFDYPGDDIARQSEFFRLKNDICDPAGCLSELCIQLAIIMVGKQCWNNFMEYLFPKFYNWWRQRKHKQQTKDESHMHMSWEQDYHLQDPGRLALFDEYLEMVLQYGFVTLFVAAFPLAPLFALLNNIAEIRLDAYKMVTQARRPLAERVEDIGAWYGILKIITYTAVVSNAFVIAYTSDFIPRMVYKYVYSDNYDLAGYINHSLSEFKTADYKEEWGAPMSTWDPDICLYRGYRTGPDDKDPYGLSSHYWHVFAARLAFVVVFEHVVFVLTGIMQFIIPGVPAEVKTQIQREQLLAKEAKYQHGLRKAKETDYEELLQAIRDQSDNSRQGGGGARGNWARRLSRVSDGLDAHVEVQQRPRQSIESTVWEVT